MHKYKCKTHPTYLGRRQPTAKCPDCWIMYMTKEIETLKQMNEALRKELEILKKADHTDIYKRVMKLEASNMVY